MNSQPSEISAALALLSAEAVRGRAQKMLELARNDALAHFRLDMSKMDAVIDLVLATTRAAYPTLDVPFHSRWRHFSLQGRDRWAPVAAATSWPDAAARGRAEFDLAITSVLLDAGAGAAWRYRDPATGEAIGRSEGLGLASLAMFCDGALSADPAQPLRADASRLAELSVDDLARGFQVTPDNPLLGLDGRCALLRRLGAQVASRPDVFGRNDRPRPGGLFDHLVAQAEDNRLPAPIILAEVLRQLGPIWPSRLSLGGIALGDCWKHPALGLVPFHKLSQWLSYSLIEPLQRAGIEVTEIDGLTGLAEYRNGGLFVDGGVLVFRDPAEAARDHSVDSALVVEWRALTVALLDEVANGVRDKLQLDASTLPLAKVLEGGTWAAGRVLARERRADASPPVRVISDGTVF